MTYTFTCPICGKLGISESSRQMYCLPEIGQKRSKCYRKAKKKWDKASIDPRYKHKKINVLEQCEAEINDPSRESRILYLIELIATGINEHGSEWVELDVNCL